MMQRSTANSYIQQENYLAELIITQTIVSKEIKKELQHIADKIIAHILDPILTVLFRKNIQGVADLPDAYKKTVENLATQNIDAEIPFGAVLHGFQRKEQITASIEIVRTLFLTFKKHLANVDSISTIQDLLKIYKPMADLSFCYFEFLHELHGIHFTQIKDMVWLTPEEMDARILRSELGFQEQLAITNGLGTVADIDLLPKEKGIGMSSAKSLFAGASMQWRIDIIIKQFDDATMLYNTLKAENGVETDNKIKKAEEALMQATKKMQCYRIPLIKSERQLSVVYAERYKTTFEKLASINKDTTLPLIANISRSTARTLISLQDMNAFTTENNQFNLSLLQLMGNSCAAFYIWGGNHSLTEAAEIYNRVLDYMLLFHPQQLPCNIFPSEPLPVPYMTTENIPEKKLPYYRIGNYQSFLRSDFLLGDAPVENQITTYYQKKFM